MTHVGNIHRVGQHWMYMHVAASRVSFILHMNVHGIVVNVYSHSVYTPSFILVPSFLLCMDLEMGCVSATIY